MQVPSPPLPPEPSPNDAAAAARKARSSREQYIGSHVSPTLPPQQHSRSDTSRSPTRLRAPPILHQPQPIQDAVNSAFNQSPNVNQYDPELIKQVAEQVIKNLQNATLAAGPTPTTYQQPTSHATGSFPLQVPRSPTQSSTDSTTRRYTPPTPDRPPDLREGRRYGSSSPEPVPSDAGSTISSVGVESVRSRESERSRATQRPSHTSTGRSRRGTNASSDARETDPDGYKSRAKEAGGSEGTPRDHTPFRRDKAASEVSYDGASHSRPRPAKAPSNDGDAEEATTLEKIWQPLFESGVPTVRLSQFLRGLALHLIDDYEPKGSLVVTPAKMLRFFNETKTADERYPWDTIFGGKMTCASLSMMYRKLLCQHHFIQAQNHEQPNVPCLTPNGFDWFMTCMMQAHPDIEFERLSKAVMNMPISNADNKSDRFPKELPRRLLPAEGNLQAEQRLVSSLVHEPYLVPNLKGASSMPPPPPTSVHSTQPNQPNPLPERERKPYSGASMQSSAVDDDDTSGTQIPLERERKPYFAKEGMGKVYSADDATRPPMVQQRSEAKPAQTSSSRPSRTASSIASQAPYGSSSGPTEPMNIPPRTHRMSTGAPPPMASGGYRGRRSSPPYAMQNSYARSDPADVGGIPSAQYGSNLHQTYSREQYAAETEENDLRRYRSRGPSTRDNQEDDSNASRGYPIPGRGVPANSGYEYGGGGPVGSAPVPGPPLSTYPSRPSRPTGPPGANDDRRRSMHAGFADGGTDGYGSFSSAGSAGGHPSQQSYGPSAQH